MRLRSLFPGAHGIGGGGPTASSSGAGATGATGPTGPTGATGPAGGGSARVSTYHGVGESDGELALGYQYETHGMAVCMVTTGAAQTVTKMACYCTKLEDDVYQKMHLCIYSAAPLGAGAVLLAQSVEFNVALGLNVAELTAPFNMAEETRYYLAVISQEAHCFARVTVWGVAPADSVPFAATSEIIPGEEAEIPADLSLLTISTNGLWIEAF